MNEESIDLSSLQKNYKSVYEFEVEEYSGGIPYMLLLQSMVLRIPHPLKRLYARPLLKAEPLLRNFWPRNLSTIVSARWRKK